MCGLVIGTLCLWGLLRLSCFRRWGGGGCGGGGCHSHHGGGGDWGGPWWVSRPFLRMMFERLDTTPGQEKAIMAAVEELRSAARSQWGTMRTSREEMVRSFGAESLDESAMGAAFAHQREALEAMQKAMADAMGKIHTALDARQRAVLTELLSRGPGGGPRWGWARTAGAPYRF